ncbi:MAG TPA: AI-2E family transporter [Actinomycetota bacterium]|jgi:predicted PurR-regulated permease PerM|nr:AI-2E family transporter [Actinomycetota bacterium]
MDPAGASEGATAPIADARSRTEEIGDPTQEARAQRMPPWIPRLLLLVVLTFFAAYASFSLFRRLQSLFVWLVASLFLSFALEPAVNWLSQHGWRRGAATGLVLFGFASVLVVMIAAMVPLVIDQVQELVQRAPGWLDQASVYTERWFGIQLTGERILRAIASAQADVQNLAANIASVGAFLLSLVFQVLTIGLFTFYLVADGPRFRRTVCSVLTPRRQREVLAAWEIAIDKTGGYLYSRLLLAIVNALVTFVVLTMLGIPFPVPLALWQGFVSQFIPVVGTYIAAAIPLLVALLEDPVAALVFLIFVVIYQQIENYLLAPRITARTMQLHPAIAFFAALAGGTISGLLGAFMALPAAAVIQATVSSYLTRHEVVESELTREIEPLPNDRTPTAETPARGGVLSRVSSRLRQGRGGDPT